MEAQVKSKQRVADHGEVLTGKREVNAMLDLVKPETERIESRFLEPACGTGNFLVEILKRKLNVVEQRYGTSQLDFERYAVLAISSIYGIDILADNTQQCRRRLYNVFNDGYYFRLFKDLAQPKCRDTVRYILERNIVWGDALDLKTMHEPRVPIVFSEWSPIKGSIFKRRDFTFRSLFRQEAPDQGWLFPELEQKPAEQLQLFSDLGEEVFIPVPEKEFPPVHFLEIAYAQP